MTDLLLRQKLAESTNLQIGAELILTRATRSVCSNEKIENPITV